jgi:hypothetical protein
LEHSDIPSWEWAKHEFADKRSLRDVLVQGIGKEHWAIALDWLYSHADRFEIEPHGTPPLRSYDEAQALRDHQIPTAKFYFSNFQFNTHFVWDREIELDFEPGAVQTEADYRMLLHICRQLAVVLDRPVLVTHENMEDQLILCVGPNDATQN